MKTMALRTKNVTAEGGPTRVDEGAIVKNKQKEHRQMDTINKTLVGTQLESIRTAENKVVRSL